MKKKNYFVEMYKDKGKRFFVNGKEITFEEALEIDNENARLQDCDVVDWQRFVFITII